MHSIARGEKFSADDQISMRRAAGNGVSEFESRATPRVNLARADNARGNEYTHTRVEAHAHAYIHGRRSIFIRARIEDELSIHFAPALATGRDKEMLVGFR